ncbi:MAG: amino acid permease, partial [Planctomycetaceae bacterium]|nr:amino acid permease [Planctomycetaceae bacterium]
HWSMSLAGTIGCVAVMFLMNWVWATISILMIAGLHWFIRFREIESRWGDLNSGVIFERSRQSLLRLEQEAYHPKNWRPIILALSGTAWTRPHLAIYGYWLTAGHGILSLGHIVTGNIEDYAERREKFELTLRKFINDEELLAFPAVVISPYISDGIEALVQCHGIGGLRPNTILLGWPGDEQKSETFGATVRLVSRLGRSVIAIRFRDSKVENAWGVPEGTIDVWWRGKKNGSLMLLLAHLLHQNPEWRGNRIRMLRSVPTETGRDEVIKHIEDQSALARISVEPVAIISENAETAIQHHSRNAAIVILGFESPEEGKEAEFFHHMEAFVGDLPRVLFVNSAGGMELES